MGFSGQKALQSAGNQPLGICDVVLSSSFIDNHCDKKNRDNKGNIKYNFIKSSCFFYT